MDSSYMPACVPNAHFWREFEDSGSMDLEASRGSLFSVW